MFRISTWAFCALAPMLSTLHAQPAVIVTLASVGDRIHNQNPSLAAARLRIEEARGRLNQAGRLENPRLETSLEHNPKFREGKIEIGLSQQFPVTGRLRLEKEIKRTELDAAHIEVREVERQLTGQAREAVVKLLAIRERRGLLNKQADLTRDFAERLSKIAAKGEGSPLDAGQAKLEAAGVAMELRQLDATEAALAGTLKPLLGMRPDEAVSIGGTLPEAVLPDTAVDPSRRPDFQIAKLEARAAAQGVVLEQFRSREDWEGGFFTGVERSEDVPEGYETEAMVGIQLKIPWPLWNRNEGNIQEARAKQARVEKEAVALSRGIRLEAGSARAEMEQWAKMIHEIDDTLLPLADEQTDFATTTYQNGQGEIQAVLRSREKRLQLVLARLEALQEFHLARVRHEAATGTF